MHIKIDLSVLSRTIFFALSNASTTRNTRFQLSSTWSMTQTMVVRFSSSISDMNVALLLCHLRQVMKVSSAVSVTPEKYKQYSVISPSCGGTGGSIWDQSKMQLGIATCNMSTLRTIARWFSQQFLIKSVCPDHCSLQILSNLLISLLYHHSFI